jgi:hypothetical protein
VTIETLAPGLPVTDLLGIAAFAALLVTLLLWFAYHLGQVKGAARPVTPPEEAPLIVYDSIMTIAYYDWFADRKDEIELAILQRSENESLRSQIAANKRNDDATESAYKKEIDKINSAHGDEVRRLHELLTARERAYGEKIGKINNASDTRERRLREEITIKDSAHKEDIARRERSYQWQIADIKATHKKRIADVETYAHNHRNNLYYEAQRRKDAEDKWDALVTSNMYASGLPKTTAQTPPQDGVADSTGDQLLIDAAAALSSIAQNAAPDSSTDQLLLAPPVTEGLTREADEALPSEPASPTITPELDSAEPASETSPQDVAPGTEDQLSPPPAATESPITEAKEASPVAIPSPIAEVEDELPAETEGLSEAESTNSTEHEQEQGEEEDDDDDEKVEDEPRNSGTPLLEPSSMGEGAEQIPQDQEKGLAQDAPVPTEEPAATSQLTEPEAAPGPATSDDGASEAPVTKEVLPEEQTGDRETKEPTPVEESEEVRGAATSGGGASMTPVTTENGNGLEMAIAGQSDQPPPVSTAQAVPDEPAEGMDLEEDSPDVPSTLEWQSAATNGSESFEEACASESSTSLSPPNAAIVELDDEMSDALPDETKSPHDIELDDGNATVNNSGYEQDNSAIETDGDSPMDEDSNENAAIDSENGSSTRTGEEWLASDMVQDGGNGTPNGIGYQSNNAALEMARHSHQMLSGNHGVPSHINDVPTTEMAQHSHQTLSANHGLPSHINKVPTTEMAQPSHQVRSNDQGPPSQFNNVPPTETAPLNIRLGASSGPIKWNLSGPAVFWRQLQWRGTIEWDLSGPPTFTRPFRISQPTQQSMTSRRGLPKLRVSAELGGKVATQNTLSFKWQPPPPPVTQANHPLASLAEDRLLVKVAAINTWVMAANSLCELLERSPQDGGLRAASFRRMKFDPTSEISQIIADTALAVTFLEGGIKKFDMTDDAKTVLGFLTLKEVLTMREQYKQLGESKGCPELFVFWLQDIDRMLRALRDLVPESSTSQAQPQQPRVNPLLAPKYKDKPVDVAKEIRAWASDAKDKCHSWEFDPEEGGTDAQFFRKMNDDTSSPLWTIVIQMGDAADYLEHERQTESQSLAVASSYYRYKVVSLVESMRGQYEELGTLKECPEVFKFLLIHLDRVLKVLSELLKEESSKPPAQRQSAALSIQQSPSQQPVLQNGNPPLLGTHPQPVVQNTQQIPPQQPPAQNANPLFSFDPPSEAAKEVQRYITIRADLPIKIRQMEWAADYMENRKSTSRANFFLRGCLGEIHKIHRHYKDMYEESGHDPVLGSLVEDINRVWDELKKVK